MSSPTERIAIIVARIEGVATEEQFDALTLELYWQARLLRDQAQAAKASRKAARSMIA
ncbi:hypothetical protein [Silvibacterium acidisoli]|uniref:hypothetical protein n=1 Tax=Acidobacteriaceae bacterium ZG23-2 TaxID=2883246 RepID=UPI00406CAEA3